MPKKKYMKEIQPGKQQLHPIELLGYECYKCGHKWTPKRKYPSKWCPERHCHSERWWIKPKR